MLVKKVFIPVFIFSLLFVNQFIGRDTMAAAAPSGDSGGTEVVQVQQLLNNMGFWIGAAEGILGSQAYQEVVKFQVETNLVADGLVGLQTRQTPSVATILDSTSTINQVLAENPASTAVEPSQSVNKTTVEVAERPASTVSRGTSTPSRSGQVISMISTGYDGCYECNKPYYGYPSYIGLPLAYGIVAVDPKVIPMGTRLYIEGYGDAIAADQGNAIKGNRIDLFFDSHQQALNWGMKTVKVTILGK